MNSQSEILGMIATEAVEPVPQTIPARIPKFNVGDRCIPLSPCLLIAGTIESYWTHHSVSLQRPVFRYKIKLDIPHRKGKHSISTVERNEDEIEYTSKTWEETPYATLGPQ